MSAVVYIYIYIVIKVDGGSCSLVGKSLCFRDKSGGFFKFIVTISHTWCNFAVVGIKMGRKLYIESPQNHDFLQRLELKIYGERERRG